MKTIGVVMLDERQKACADFLEKYGYHVLRIHDQNELEEIASMNAIVLPVRGVDEQERIIYSDGTILDFRLMKKLMECGYAVHVFAGISNKKVDSWNLPVTYLMEKDSVIEANAKLTAQGVLAVILQEIKVDIQSLLIDVIGYGHCGKWIVRYLHGLNIPVRLVRRKTSPNHDIKEISLIDWRERSVVGDIVINTAPAMIIDQSRIETMQNHPLVIDIASKPGGVDYEAAKQKGLRVIIAPPLPAVYTPVSAGEILAKTIKEEMNHIG